ncbi:MAG: hypothetical protein Q8R16_03980, partial [bacterium]|nr:hypothetical protein [bacterium]
RGKHYEGERAGRSVSYSEESSHTPVSPFWHKVKFYEAKLIHDAFPDSTLEMSVAYDPRITPDADGGATFTPDVERPVTVTHEVEGDPGVRAERDRIIREAYDQVWASREPDEDGVMRTKRESGAFHLADIAMAQRFGFELMPMVSHDRDLHAWIPKNIQWIRSVNPTSDIIPMLEAGLIPIHAGVNFVPTAESDPERGPRGVYLELAVGDLERLRTKLHERCGDEACRTQINRRIERYAMYRVLDDLYDSIFIDQHLLGATDVLNDPEVMNAAFQMLRVAQERIERDGLARADVWLSDIREHLRALWHRTARSADHKQAILAVFEAIRTEVAGGADGVQERA